MNISNLSDNENELFSFIHNTIMPKRKKDFQTKGITSLDNIIVKPILVKAKQILDMFNKQNYDLSKYYIEFQQRNCGFEKKCNRSFDWHEDNYGAVSFAVYTIIFYIRKDNTIKGGNLEYRYKNKS